MGEFGGGDPAGFGDLEEGDLAGDVAAEEGVKADVGVGVFVFDDVAGAGDGDGEIGFLFDFAEGAGFGGFVGLALTAGEFPVAAEDGVGFAFADEDVAGGVEDDGNGDFDAIVRGGGFGVHGGPSRKGKPSAIAGQGMATIAD